ncbi:phage holin family protein [uncultured Helicobacter sp.]|mgnify:CR=1 FL=1|uniref:phage holin family protein n=1 Tax=uncultured Helicobacter sp. TaxID=175537 RepID=UPI0025E8F22E|nr:phage holin family protein [uncultured Helicobacter sp.]
MDILNIDWNYFWVFMMALVMGFLTALRLYDAEEKHHKGKFVRRLIIATIGSMFLTFLFYEICIFFEFPNSLSVMLGGGAGFLGSDTMSRLAIKWIENKFNAK